MLKGCMTGKFFVRIILQKFVYLYAGKHIVYQGLFLKAYDCFFKPGKMQAPDSEI